MRLIQFSAPGGSRHVGIVDGDQIHQVREVESVREVALMAVARGTKIEDEILRLGSGQSHDYATLLATGKVLPPIDHPDAAHTIIAGTGLTHIGSAASRSAMHDTAQNAAETDMNDTMRMFKWGLDGGRPAEGRAGVQPEWFYKGDGSMVAPPGADLLAPDFGIDVGEEPEIVGLYMIGEDNRPYRLGYAIGNEVTDHVMEKQNYLYLAHAKLRQCSFGPELFLGDLPASVEGRARILRAGETIWEKPFPTGEENMSHSIANIEFHHFKYNHFLRAGDVHVIFMGTSVASFADGAKTQPGDVFEIDIPLFGRPLTNTVRLVETRTSPGGIRQL